MDHSSLDEPELQIHDRAADIRRTISAQRTLWPGENIPTLELCTLGIFRHGSRRKLNSLYLWERFYCLLFPQQKIRILATFSCLFVENNQVKLADMWNDKYIPIKMVLFPVLCPPQLAALWLSDGTPGPVPASPT